MTSLINAPLIKVARKTIFDSELYFSQNYMGLNTTRSRRWPGAAFPIREIDNPSSEVFATDSFNQLHHKKVLSTKIYSTPNSRIYNFVTALYENLREKNGRHQYVGDICLRFLVLGGFPGFRFLLELDVASGPKRRKEASSPPTCCI